MLMEKLEDRMSELTADRADMKNRIRRVHPDTDPDMGRVQIAVLTSEIRDIRRELKICSQVQERSGHVRENLEIIDRERQAERNR